jgi:hypothetical protein
MSKMGEISEKRPDDTPKDPILTSAIILKILFQDTDTI